MSWKFHVISYSRLKVMHIIPYLVLWVLSYNYVNGRNLKRNRMVEHGQKLIPANRHNAWEGNLSRKNVWVHLSDSHVSRLVAKRQTASPFKRKSAPIHQVLLLLWRFEIQRSQVQDPFWPLIEFVSGSPWFNFPAALVNSQLVCIRPVGIYNHSCCCYSVLSFRCVSLALKSPYGEQSIKYVFYCIVSLVTFYGIYCFFYLEGIAAWIRELCWLLATLMSIHRLVCS